MKIGIYTPYLDTLSGGEKYMITLALTLAKKHHVVLFWDTERDDIQKKAREKLSLDISSIPFVENIFSPKVSFLKRFRQSGTYDLIIVLSDGSIPIIQSRLMLHIQHPLEWVNGKTLRTKAKLKRVEKVICNSQFTKKYIDNTFGIQSDVLYPPVLIESSSVTKKNVILTVGRIEKDDHGSYFKKQDVMITAFKKLVDNGLNGWELHLVVSTRDGQEHFIDELQKKIGTYPITLLKNVPYTKLWEEYTIAKIYWHAAGFGEDIEKHPEKAEHFGISTVEAMGAGAVPIVINCGGQKEIINNGDNGFLWDTLDELEKKTLNVINDRTLMQSVSKKAHQSAKAYSLSSFEERVYEIIH